MAKLILSITSGIRYIAILSAPILLLTQCAPSAPSNQELAMEIIIESAGDNRDQIERVIEHYKTTDPDSEKLEAAYFLIANMYSKYTVASPVDQVYTDGLSKIAEF